MSATNDHIDQTNDSAYFSDNLLDFECKQAMLRKKYSEPEVDTEWNKFKEATIFQETINLKPRKISLKRRYFAFGSLAGVAAVLLLLLVVHWYADFQKNRPVQVFLAEERPQVITMQVSNSNAISVNQAKVNDPLAGVVIDSRHADFSKIQSNEIQTRTIKTPYGKDYRVILNDGTEVIMNAGSKLIFPTHFTGKERSVSLEGEAYFKVVKNPAFPFLVKTKRMDTRAYGTQFNVRAYKGTEPHVTLIEGMVTVNIPDMKKIVKLSPSEDVSLSKETLRIKNIDSQYYIQWKDGFLYYDNVSLKEVLSDVGRWYNVNIEIEKPALMSYRLHFVVNRDAGIEDVIENLNNFGYLHVSRVGNKIMIGEKKNS